MNEIDKLKFEIETIKNEWQAEKARNHDLQKQNVEISNKLYLLFAQINYRQIIKFRQEFDCILSELHNELSKEFNEQLEDVVEQKITEKLEKIDKTIDQLLSNQRKGLKHELISLWEDFAANIIKQG